jgi:predicted dehydrogenase
MTHSGPIPFAVVGHGWRADFFHRVARAVPDRFRCVGVVTRGPEAGSAVERAWGVPTFRRIDAMLERASPLVVVTSVPWAATPGVVRELVGADVAVLAETPPAPDAEGLRRLWSDVGASDLVQVAEQNPFLPVLAAVQGVVATGALGRVTSASLSWTHGYHAVAVLRRLLGVRGEATVVRATALDGPLVRGPDRGGRPPDPADVAARHTVATLTWPQGIGSYDFTDGQWFHPLRRRHLAVRGSRGEIVGTSVTWAGEDGRPLDAPVVRRQTGLDGDLEGADLDVHTWAGHTVHRNPYRGARLSDEEIAIATLLELTGRWRRGEVAGPYPLAEACQDHLLALAIEESASSGEGVTTGVEPWADALAPERPPQP